MAAVRVTKPFSTAQSRTFVKSVDSTVLLSETVGLTYPDPHVRIASCGSASRIHPCHPRKFWRRYRFHSEWMELRYHWIDRRGCTPNCEKTQIGETDCERVFRESFKGASLVIHAPTCLARSDFSSISFDSLHGAYHRCSWSNLGMA